MDTAPHDERILIDAELQSDQPENAINDWVFARWDDQDGWWRLSPHLRLRGWMARRETCKVPA
jgi:hypothetical protein